MTRHFSHYLVLFGLLAATILGFNLFSWDRAFQTAIIVAMAASYVSWGIVHHFLHDDLYFEVVIEYVAIAVLGSALVLLVVL